MKPFYPPLEEWQGKKKAMSIGAILAVEPGEMD